MPSLYLIISGLLYICSASLTFWATKETHFALAAIIGALTAILWAGIARTVAPSSLLLWGLAYDTMLTVIFVVVPVYYNAYQMTYKNTLGAAMVLIGLAVLKG